MKLVAVIGRINKNWRESSKAHRNKNGENQGKKVHPTVLSDTKIKKTEN